LFDAGLNNIVTNLSLRFTGTFSDSSGDVLHQLVFSGSSIYGAFGSFATNTALDLGSTGLQVGITPSTPGTQTVAAFTVNVTTATGQGLALPSTGQYTVRATYTYELQDQGGDVPEPSTLALVGGVLVLAGIRKFRR
jgi:hypothetical protein